MDVRALSNARIPLNVSQVLSEPWVAATNSMDGSFRNQPFAPKAAAALSMLRHPRSSQHVLYLTSAVPAPNHRMPLVGSSRAHQIVPQALVVMRACRVKTLEVGSMGSCPLRSSYTPAPTALPEWKLETSLPS